MKADRYGPWTEQKMYRMGYLTSTERQDKRLFGKKCSNCQARIDTPGSKRVRCGLGDFATTINATCNQWEARL